MRRALVLLLLCLAAPSAALEEPRLTAELEAGETVVGQPLILRLKILVPTWMPSPPAFPTFEVPGVMVRLPERASGPVSETVEGETWSGIQRSYRLYPLGAGQIEIPGQTMTVTYADPDAPDPVTVDLPVAPVRFTATVPDAARGLDPLILATGFTLEETVSIPEELEVGGAVTRSLTARIEGTTPVLIPALLPPLDQAGLRAYPEEPKVAEEEDRGILSGTRTEAATYLATAEGSADLPEISFDW